ncbi:MAG: TolC family protein [Bacteroidetes bacterium]|nr:TolC family protein [Bacteroidota bacterium]
MRNISLTVLILALISFWNIAYTQNKSSFSLDEAIEFALMNNHNVKNAQTDVELARQKVRETTAIGLPQVNGKITNTNYINIPTTLMPDFLSPIIHKVNEDDFGLTPINPLGDATFFPAQFGTKYNATAELSVAQLIFNGSYLVGLQAARAYLDQSKVQLVKSNIDTKEQISKAYFLVLTTEQNKIVLDSTLKSLINMASETAEIYKQGFIEELNVDQINLMVKDLEATLVYVNNQIVLARYYLKLLMGFDINEPIYLSDQIESLLSQYSETSLLIAPFDFNHHIDYKILENQKDLSRLSLKNEQSTYLPSISGFFTAQTNAMRDKYNFLSGGERWYPTTVWGLQMDIPIFSSGSRGSKVQQAKLNLQKVKEMGMQLQESLTIEEKNTKTNFKNALLILDNKHTSLKLAKKIYQNTSLKFSEGISSNMDLLQAYNQYLAAESEHNNAILELVNAKIALEKLFTE